MRDIMIMNKKHFEKRIEALPSTMSDIKHILYSALYNIQLYNDSDSYRETYDSELISKDIYNKIEGGELRYLIRQLQADIFDSFDRIKNDLDYDKFIVKYPIIGKAVYNFNKCDINESYKFMEEHAYIGEYYDITDFLKGYYADEINISEVYSHLFDWGELITELELGGFVFLVNEDNASILIFELL